DGTDKLISYDGCGCAGGQVTTVQGESVPYNSSTARRTQKVYEDVLGRSYKTELLDWDISVYSTEVKTFNARDQVTQVRTYSGTTSSSTFQDVTMSYDGHARLKNEHHPEQQDSSGNPTYTTYNYFADDNIDSVVDARGASTSYAYNSRGLVTQISYSGGG